MRIPCPFCGDRDGGEFTVRGEVAEALFVRDNLRGPTEEFWYHAQGCRRWLIVRRDTRTHEVLGSHFPEAAP